MPGRRDSVHSFVLLTYTVSNITVFSVIYTHLHFLYLLSVKFSFFFFPLTVLFFFVELLYAFDDLWRKRTAKDI